MYDELVYDQVHSVRDWQTRHYNVENMAFAFCCVNQLVGSEIDCDVAHPRADRRFRSMLQVHLDVAWLQLTLAAVRRKQAGELVHVYVGLQTETKLVGDTTQRSAGNWGTWSALITTRIYCRPADAVAFGGKLLDEIAVVEKMRTELGIPGYGVSLSGDDE